MKRSFVVILMVLLLANSVQARESGPYFSGFGGVTKPNQMDLEDNFGTTLELDLNTGFNAGAAIGYQFDKFRVALEYAHRKNNLDEISDFSGTFGVDGNVRSNSYMGAAYFDFVNKSPFTPYVGTGIGIANVSMNDLRAEGTSVVVIDDSDTALAYKVEGGVLFDITKNVALLAAYEYFATRDLDMTTKASFGGDDFETNYKNHNFKVGLKYRF